MNEAVEKIRTTKLLCEYCYLNQGGMAGQSLTNWDCHICKGQHISGSTATPNICKGCALSTGRCEECGVDDHIYQDKEKE